MVWGIGVAHMEMQSEFREDAWYWRPRGHTRPPKPALDPVLTQLDAITHIYLPSWEFRVTTCTETHRWRLWDSEVLICTLLPPLKSRWDESHLTESSSNISNTRYRIGKNYELSLTQVFRDSPASLCSLEQKGQVPVWTSPVKFEHWIGIK